MVGSPPLNHRTLPQQLMAICRGSRRNFRTKRSPATLCSTCSKLELGEGGSPTICRCLERAPCKLLGPSNGNRCGTYAGKHSLSKAQAESAADVSKPHAGPSICEPLYHAMPANKQKTTGLNFKRSEAVTFHSYIILYDDPNMTLL